MAFGHHLSCVQVVSLIHDYPTAFARLYIITEIKQKSKHKAEQNGKEEKST